MLSYCLGTVNDFHRGFKLSAIIANVTLTEHSMEKREKIKMIKTFYPGHI